MKGLCWPKANVLYKAMMVFLKFSGQILKKTIPLQALRFYLNCLNQTYISLKSIMQLTKTFSPDSATFIEKMREKINYGEKLNFCGE